MATVTINPEVLRWAISESGLTVQELSGRVAADVEAWLKRKAKPSVTELRAVANVLKRPFATFFLPSPPALDVPTVQFRHPTNDPRTSLNPDERKSIREATRQQRLLSWLVDQLDGTMFEMPAFTLDASPESAAQALRAWIGVPREKQLKWSSSAAAMRSWRTALEDRGIVVFSLPMGSASRLLDLGTAPAGDRGEFGLEPRGADFLHVPRARAPGDEDQLGVRSAGDPPRHRYGPR